MKWMISAILILCGTMTAQAAQDEKNGTPFFTSEELPNIANFLPAPTRIRVSSIRVRPDTTPMGKTTAPERGARPNGYQRDSRYRHRGSQEST